MHDDPRAEKATPSSLDTKILVQESNMFDAIGRSYFMTRAATIARDVTLTSKGFSCMVPKDKVGMAKTLIQVAGKKL